jgi:hypothetical protein
MNEFFSGLVASARIALAAFYQSLFSQALSTSADELADWYKLDPIEVDLEDGVEVYAKRLALPVWDLVDPDYAAEIASDLMLEFEAKHNMHLCSYTGDGEFVVYITNEEIELDALRLAFDDLEDPDEEEEEELQELDGSELEQKPESGRVLSMVPRIGQSAPVAPVEIEADFPEEDFPEEEPVTASTPAPAPTQAAPAELEDAPLVEEEPLPEEAPVNEAQAVAAPTETNAEADALANALNGEPVHAQEPLTEAETVAVIAERSDSQPEQVAETSTLEEIVDTGPVKESAEIIAAIHAEKMQQLKDMLPSDTMSEIDEETGVMTLMYSREVNGENVDYVRNIRLENENFQNIRYVDVFYVENEEGVALHRTTNAQGVIAKLDNLNA